MIEISYVKVWHLDIWDRTARHLEAQTVKNRGVCRQSRCVEWFLSVQQCTLYSIPSATYTQGQIIKQFVGGTLTAQGTVAASVVKLTGAFKTGVKDIHYWGNVGEDVTSVTIVIAAPTVAVSRLSADVSVLPCHCLFSLSNLLVQLLLSQFSHFLSWHLLLLSDIPSRGDCYNQTD